MAYGIGRNRAMDEGGEAGKKWAQKATKRMEKKGTVGAFTAQASKAGYDSPLEYAGHVMSHTEDYPTKTVRRAAFAKNINK
jgi:hypothetical protein